MGGGRRSRSMRVFVLFALTALLAAGCDWAQFHSEPAHSGAGVEGSIGPANVGILTERWSAAIGSPVESSPAVASGVAYVGSADGSLHAYDAMTGASKWSATTGGPVESSPAVDNGTVYIGSDDHNLYAFGTDGTQKWVVPVDATFAGLASAPTVINGFVYVSSAQTLYAFNASDGTLAWSTFVGSTTALSAPAVANGLVYVDSYADAKVYAYHADTGALAWTATPPSAPNPSTCASATPSPAVAGGIVYAALCPASSGGPSLLAYNATSGAQTWASGTAAASTTPAVSAGVVYVGSAAGKAVEAHNANTGALLWSADTEGAVYSSPAAAGGVVYVGSDDHQVYAFDANGVANCMSTPGVCKPLWTATTGGNVRSSPAVSNGLVYAGSDDGSLYAYGVPQIAFGKSVLEGTSSTNPTVERFGPDGRLYVAEFDGLIKAYTIARNGPNNYSVTDTETIDVVNQIPNHDDDGTPNPSVTTRLITGLLVTGSATHPVIYVSSSDPRVGGGPEGTQTGVDTSSGVISRLTFNGTTWQRTDLVRGLPRSEEQHATNALVLDQSTNTLYVAQGGNTNMGAPSHNFNDVPEYAYSAAILTVDLNAIGNTTYDLPTLVDDQHPELVGPFGGDAGRHQAKITPASPVQVFAPGFRNPFNLVRTRAGKLYATDNAPNAGWGDIPIGAGPNGTCTNAVHEPGISENDSLHWISGPGYYAGHPNPTRGNQANTFNSTNPQSPVPTANPIECDYRGPSTNGSLANFATATMGMAEYTASDFGGQMNGNLLIADYYGNLIRVQLNDTGTAVVSHNVLFSNVGIHPLDVATQGDRDAFPGTIWVPDFQDGSIHVFEPNDFGGQPPPPCSGVDSPTLDEDHDGFTNADEIDNHTDPCSAADAPHDWNGNFISDLNDPDDDTDGLPDVTDPFAIDPANGVSTPANVTYSWQNGAINPCAPTPVPSGCPGGLLGLGFTGLMSDGVSNYANLFDETKMTVGGAAGVLTVDQVPPGDALGSTNTQQYGFQFGVNANPANTGVFTAHTRVLAPFVGVTPQGNQSMGLFIGSGDQDNYAKLVVTANGGSPGVQFLKEVSGQDASLPVAPVTMPGPDSVDLYLTIDPVADTVQASYRITTGTDVGPITPIGNPQPIPAGWLTNPSRGLAVGLISTSAGGPTFPATWDGIGATPGGPS